MEYCGRGWCCLNTFPFFFNEGIWWKSRIWVGCNPPNWSHLANRHIVYTSHVGSLYIQWRGETPSSLLLWPLRAYVEGLLWFWTIFPQEDLIFLAGICQKCWLKRKNLFECVFHKNLCSLKIFWSFTLNSIQTEIKPKRYLVASFLFPYSNTLCLLSIFLFIFLSFSSGRRTEQRTQRVWGWLSLFNKPVKGFLNIQPAMCSGLSGHLWLHHRIFSAELCGIKWAGLPLHFLPSH